MVRGSTRVLAVVLAVAVTGCGGNGSDPAPDPAPGPLEISISPESGTHETDVTVRASGFEPGARVGIGVGPPQSEYEIFAHATADSEGRVVTTVNVPDWTESGRDYLFAARAPDGEDVISSEFRVTTGGENADGGDTLVVTGELTDEGVECPALRTGDGELYTLAGDTGDFDVGDHVRVEGSIAEMSMCMQGTTIAVESISAAG